MKAQIPSIPPLQVSCLPARFTDLFGTSREHISSGPEVVGSDLALATRAVIKWHDCVGRS